MRGFGCALLYLCSLVPAVSLTDTMACEDTSLLAVQSRANVSASSWSWTFKFYIRNNLKEDINLKNAFHVTGSDGPESAHIQPTVLSPGGRTEAVEFDSWSGARDFWFMNVDMKCGGGDDMETWELSTRHDYALGVACPAGMKCNLGEDDRHHEIDVAIEQALIDGWDWHGDRGAIFGRINLPSGHCQGPFTVPGERATCVVTEGDQTERRTADIC
eukprot:TRINITY_DN19263_c0_g1_i6.p1 TRINITY_DN19263_c0_g1~~TRINITY_DN19263_c0_g1_i6.p1  ORF type:complete len:216 (-),score=13.89 TRINITY_DN19263_c0_g1_i6:247-894(-)